MKRMIRALRWLARWLREPAELRTRKGAPVSIEVGQKIELSLLFTDALEWRSSNAAFRVADSVLEAPAEDMVGSEARTTVTGFDNSGALVATHDFSVVPWCVGERSIEILHELGQYSIVGWIDGYIYFTQGNALCRRRANYPKVEMLCRLPAKQPYRSDLPLIQSTPVGYFLRLDHHLLRSVDLKEWHVESEFRARCMFHGLDHLVADDGTVYLFTIEYSTESSRSHALWRGEYTPEGQSDWKIAKEFLPTEKHYTDISKPSARHIHLVRCDRENGLCWIATGDSDIESGIWVSGDFGESFAVFALGSQKYRTLSIWFSDKYLYWNMDTHKEDQIIWRVPRPGDFQEAQRYAPSQVITDGILVPGNAYLPLRSHGTQLKRGKTYNPSTPEPVTGDDCYILPLRQDAVLEEAARLPYGAQWYTAPIPGQNAFLMSASPESRVPGTGEVPHRDFNSRLFLLEESETAMLVEEVLAAGPAPDLSNPKSLRYNRIDPRVVDSRGQALLMAHNNVFSGALLGKLVKIR